MKSTPKRLFVAIEDKTFLEGFKVAPGQFVATRLALRLGARITLSMQAGDDDRRLEVPAVVVGRRTPAAPQSALRAGVIVRLSDPFHPNLEVMEGLLDGTVVDFQEQRRLVRPPPVTATFSSADELLSEVGLLREGKPAQLPLDRPVSRGERLLVTLTLDPPGVRGQPRPPMPAAAATCVVDVKTVVRHDDESACLAELAEPTASEPLDALIRTISGGDFEGSGTLGR